jgi:hypothetical protein
VPFYFSFLGITDSITGSQLPVKLVDIFQAPLLFPCPVDALVV